MRIAPKIAVALFALASSAWAHSGSTELAEAARAFVATLTPEQKARTVFAMTDAERENWHYVPKTRAGLTLKEMSAAQRGQALALVRKGLSEEGHLQLEKIMSLEAVLREIEGSAHRDAGLYTLAIFGDPQSKGIWSWRFEGHHVSINFTLVGDAHIATTPSFFGANPAEVRRGPLTGLRALDQEEDLGRGLLASLDKDQRELAVLPISVPRDIVTGSKRQISLEKPQGLPVARLSAEQRVLFLKLIQRYVQRYRADVAEPILEKIQTVEWPHLHFAWVGSDKPGAPHYYRIQGSTFVIEYDNVQNGANHIHTVWRDAGEDFGRDLLREHHLRDHGSQPARGPE